MQVVPGRVRWLSAVFYAGGGWDGEIEENEGKQTNIQSMQCTKHNHTHPQNAFTPTPAPRTQNTHTHTPPPRTLFPSIRHNEIRDITADLLTEICHDVSVEPDLQPLTGETLAHRTANISDGARLDVSMKGFWGGRQEKTFLDVRVFNPCFVKQKL